MKNKFFILILMFIFLIACSNDDDPKEDNEQELAVTVANLEGMWLAVESRNNDGNGLEPFEAISEHNQFTYIFKNDLAVSDTFIECDGTYELNEETNILQLFFNCIEEDIIWEVSFLESNQLILASQVSEESFRVKFIKTGNKILL